MTIYSCKGCTPPKRHPGCHGTCPEYCKDKAEHDIRKAAYDKQKSIDSAIYSNRSKKVYRAMRDRYLAKRAKGR